MEREAVAEEKKIGGVGDYGERDKPFAIARNADASAFVIDNQLFVRETRPDLTSRGLRHRNLRATKTSVYLG
ncbi:hypothetical protein CTA1_13200 [Colletotrichum tanaceti]|uniref:Uncharacterized protein n=1 Tax=Colletotrichum tanaceti TaxID=1306861 RepID=A0A4U6X1C2_9PEZI|nr:hypothetical protein CTA1_13200 [Colletotrichum tanaceti]